jgi:hypothetical protein
LRDERREYEQQEQTDGFHSFILPDRASNPAFGASVLPPSGDLIVPSLINDSVRKPTEPAAARSPRHFRPRVGKRCNTRRGTFDFVQKFGS